MILIELCSANCLNYLSFCYYGKGTGLHRLRDVIRELNKPSSSEKFLWTYCHKFFPVDRVLRVLPPSACSNLLWLTTIGSITRQIEWSQDFAIFVEFNPSLTWQAISGWQHKSIVLSQSHAIFARLNCTKCNYLWDSQNLWNLKQSRGPASVTLMRPGSPNAVSTRCPPLHLVTNGWYIRMGRMEDKRTRRS